MPAVSAAPVQVRLAGILVVAQGALGVAFAVALVVRAFGVESPGSVLGQAAYFVVLAAGALAVGIALVMGYRWARTPALVLQLLLLGVAWYTTGPSDRPEYGVPAGLVCLLTAGLLLTTAARSWSEP
jgi:hypothetical protein